MVPVMAGDAPFAQLPDEVRLTRDEISVVLFALDLGLARIGDHPPVVGLARF